jgi:hypothetical protein
MSDNEQLALLTTLGQDEFDAVERRPADSIIEALQTGEDERRRAEAGLHQAVIEPNLRFA